MQQRQVEMRLADQRRQAEQKRQAELRRIHEERIIGQYFRFMEAQKVEKQRQEAHRRALQRQMERRHDSRP